MLKKNYVQLNANCYVNVLVQLKCIALSLFVYIWDKPCYVNIFLVHQFRMSFGTVYKIYKTHPSNLLLPSLLSIVLGVDSLFIAPYVFVALTNDSKDDLLKLD